MAKREIELRPDAWQRFELAVDAAAKSGPKHRVKREPGKPSPRRRRSAKKINKNRSSPKAGG